MPFVHLQVQSAYSLLNSSARINKLIEKAESFQLKALAITDFHTMYGAIAFYKQCKKHGIKPIIGLTASVILEETGESTGYPLVLLAKNNDGYRNLLKISSVLQTKSPEGIKSRWLKSYSGGLMAFTPGRTGLAEKYIQEGNSEEAVKILKRYRSLFNEGAFYLSVQKHFLQDDLKMAEELLQISNQTGLPLVAANDVHYLEKEDAFAHNCLLSIKNGSKMEDDSDYALPSNQYYFKSPSEMAELFQDCPEALENTLKIANECNVSLELGKTQLPKYPAPGGQSADEYLERLCLQGLKHRFSEPKDTYFRRLEYELDVIKQMKFSDYFLIVWDFMKYAHDHHILTGPGRGSAAGSLVAYVLKITDVDPIEHHLLFERFLNPERINMPDIDIDFPDTKRDEMIAYVAEKYGSMHVAQIVTFGTLAAKASLRDVGRVMGASAKEADVLAKLIPSKPGTTLKQAYSESKDLQNLLSESDLYKKIYETAMKIEGLPRHTSTHAAGVVLSSEPLTDIIPIQEGHNGIYLTQFSMDYLEDLGLLKMDFLGLRNLTLIDKITDLIERNEKKKIDFSLISYKDEKTFELLGQGDTTGVFQLESDGMRSVLRRLKPTDLEDIVAVNALFRPGPMENIPIFINRKHHREKIEYPHPALEPILKTTNGVIVYQEQIMEIASKMAGFSLGEADLLRRAVGKKIKEMLDQEREHFVSGCMDNGYDEVSANSIYDLIVKFANYGFNRSHAVAYSMISFQLAYLKAHYPVYFMTALLTSVIGHDEKVAQYIREAKQHGVAVLPPSINRSEYPFIVEKGSIRFSLNAIKNVGTNAVKEIYQARKKRGFADLFDFCVRVSTKIVNRKVMESLIFSGAMDEFEVERSTLLASLDLAIEHAALFSSDDENQYDLFLEEEEFSIKPKYIEVEPFKIEEMLKFEKEALGFYFSSHPASAHSFLFNRYGIVKISDARKLLHQKVKVGVFITAIRTIRTKKGEVMAFLALSDESGELEAVAFPSVYTKAGDIFSQGKVAVLSGKIENRNDRMQLIISDAETTQDLEKRTKTLFLKIEETHLAEGKLQTVQDTLKRHRGSTPVFLYYEKDKKTVQLPRDYFVDANEKCLSELKDLLGNQNIAVKD
ncbi:MAG: DNA polymerase III subunit alpha [Bacillota bacterium]